MPKAVITDSGGVTEETTVLGVPCLTLRNSTERPETVSQGTNELIGTNPSALQPALISYLRVWKTGVSLTSGMAKLESELSAF